MYCCTACLVTMPGCVPSHSRRPDHSTSSAFTLPAAIIPLMAFSQALAPPPRIGCAAIARSSAEYHGARSSVLKLSPAISGAPTDSTST